VAAEGKLTKAELAARRGENVDQFRRRLDLMDDDNVRPRRANNRANRPALSSSGSAVLRDATEWPRHSVRTDDGVRRRHTPAPPPPPPPPPRHTPADRG
jgi:hypothetical protein